LGQPIRSKDKEILGDLLRVGLNPMTHMDVPIRISANGDIRIRTVEGHCEWTPRIYSEKWEPIQSSE